MPTRRANVPPTALCLTLLAAASALIAEPIVLENEWLRAVVLPEQGGRVVALTDKRTGETLTEDVPASVAPGGSGALNDRLWGQGQVRDLETSPYKVRRVLSGQQVELVRVHKVADNAGFLLEKVISLPPGRASLLCEYALSNLSAGDWEGRFWSCNLLRPPTKSGEPLTFHFPTGHFRSEHGARPGAPGRWTWSYVPGQDKGGNYWVGNVAAAWMAVTHPDNSGVVVLLDGSYLDDLYSYRPAETFERRSLGTLEAFFGPLLLRPSADDRAREELGIAPLVGLREPGKPWRTRVEILPSPDLGDRIVGATEGLAIGANLGERSTTFVVTSATARSLAGAVSLRRLDGSEIAALGKLSVPLEPGTPARVGFGLPAPVTGSMVFEIRVAESDGKAWSMLLPVFEDPAEAREYTEQPMVARKTDFDPEVKLPVFDEGAPSPHVKWMKPLRKKPRVLLIIPEAASRHVYEVKQRFDAELNVALIAFPHYFVYGTQPEGTDPNRVLPYLLSQPHDLIVIASGTYWAIFPREIREKIVQLVEQGTSLFYVSPTVGDYFKMEMAGAQKEVLTESQVVSGAAEILTQGIPSQTIPLFSKWPTLAERLHVGQYGKGRVVVLNLPIQYIWPYGRPYLACDAVTPFVPNEERSAVELPFGEYYWVLACRLMAWAARCEVPVQVEATVAADRDKGLGTIAVLKNTRQEPLTSEASVRWLNRRGEVIDVVRKQVNLAPGDNEVPFAVKRPRKLLPGPVVGEVIVKDADGFILGSGAGETVLAAEPRVTAVNLRKFGHEPGEKAVGSVSIAGVVPEGAKMALAVYDMNRRLLSRQTVPLAPGGERIPAAERPRNLLMNGDFEASTAGPDSRGKVPTGWDRSFGQQSAIAALEIVRESRPRSAGKHCLKIATDETVRTAGLYSPLTAVDPKRPLTVSGWMRVGGALDVPQGAYLGVAWYNAAKEPVEVRRGSGLNYTYVAAGLKETKWTEVSSTFRPAPKKEEYASDEIPPDTSLAGIWVFALEYPKPVFVDDIVVTQVIGGPKLAPGRLVPFAVPASGGLSVLHRLEASVLSRSNEVLDIGWTELAVKPARPGDVAFQIWGPRASPGSTAGQMEAAIMRRVGFDYAAIDASSTPAGEVRHNALALMRLGLRPMPMNLMHIQATRESMSHVVRDPCLTDPKFREGLRERMRAYADQLRDLYPPAYFNGDENSLGSYSEQHDFCQSPTCLGRFRSFLKRKYETVERLNAEWGTTFKAWEELRPFTLAEARSSGNWVPWVEHRTYMADVLADIFAFQREVVHEADPNGRFATSGMGGPTIYNGFDWAALMPALDHMAGYARQHTGTFRSELFRSFKAAALIGTWTGYGAEHLFVRDSLWWEVLSGFFCPAYYCSDYLHTRGLIETEDAEDLARTIAEIRSGLGKLIMGGQRQAEPIAVYHSFASLVSLLPAAEAKGGIVPDNYFQSLDAYTQVLHELGYQFRFVDRRHLKAGAVAPKDLRVLIMPLAYALDEEALVRVRGFVAEGGVLIADPAFGLVQESGRKANRPDLAAWLGVKAQSPDLKWEDTMPFTVTPHGKGKVIVLNLKLWEYPRLREKGTERPARDAVREALLAANLPPPIQLKARAQIGEALWGGEVVRLAIGSGEIAALRRNTFKTLPDKKLAVQWKSPAHVYDVRRGRYFGRLQGWQGDLGPGGLLILARLPYEVAGIAATCSKGRVVQGQSAVVNARLMPAGIATARHVVHVEVYGPDRRPVAAYAGNLWMERGRCKFIVPHALNDTPGEWRAVLREVISGRQTTVTWRLGSG